MADVRYLLAYLHLLRLAHASHIANISSAAFCIMGLLAIARFGGLEDYFVWLFLHFGHCEDFRQMKACWTGKGEDFSEIWEGAQR